MPGLIPEPTALWQVVTPVDLRRGADGLSLYVQQVLQADQGAGNAYVFRNQRGNRVKLLLWDGTGVWLCQRRSHRGQFHEIELIRAFLKNLHGLRCDFLKDASTGRGLEEGELPPAWMMVSQVSGWRPIDRREITDWKQRWGVTWMFGGIVD